MHDARSGRAQASAAQAHWRGARQVSRLLRSNVFQYAVVIICGLTTGWGGAAAAAYYFAWLEYTPAVKAMMTANTNAVLSLYLPDAAFDG